MPPKERSEFCECGAPPDFDHVHRRQRHWAHFPSKVSAHAPHLPDPTNEDVHHTRYTSVHSHSTGYVTVELAGNSEPHDGSNDDGSARSANASVCEAQDSSGCTSTSRTPGSKKVDPESLSSDAHTRDSPLLITFEAVFSTTHRTRQDDPNDPSYEKTVGICWRALADLLGLKNKKAPRIHGITIASADNTTGVVLGVAFSDSNGALLTSFKDVYASQRLGELHGFHGVIFPGNSRPQLTLDILHRDSVDVIDEPISDSGLAMTVMSAHANNQPSSGYLRLTLQLHTKPIIFGTTNRIVKQDLGLTQLQPKVHLGGKNTIVHFDFAAPTALQNRSTFYIQGGVLAQVNEMVLNQLQKAHDDIVVNDFAATSIGILRVVNPCNEPVIISPIHQSGSQVNDYCHLPDATGCPCQDMVALPGVSLQGKTIYAIRPQLAYKRSGVNLFEAGLGQDWIKNGFGFSLKTTQDYQPGGNFDQDAAALRRAELHDNTRIKVVVCIERFPNSILDHITGTKTVLLCAIRLSLRSRDVGAPPVLPRELWFLILSFCHDLYFLN